MKNLLICLLLAGSLYGQSYTLNVKLKSDTTISIPVNKIQMLTFENVVSIKTTDTEVQNITSFKLLQNYPNPFNPSTIIQYQIPNASSVQIKIYDITGQLVKELLNTNQNAGSYQIEWNGKNSKNQNVVSGIYIYSVQANDVVLSKKMMLLK